MKKWIRTILLGVVALLAVYGVIRFQFFPDTGEVKGVPLESVARDISKALPETGSGEVREVPVKGMVTMLDLGATECIPCKMMAPILAKMEKQYDGKAAIIFIDVWKHREQAKRFGIRAIPTQIFFNKEGKEIYRHVGFMGESAIVKQLKKMGVG
ncbi:MAG: thioredoxin family protein [Desulfobacterales bacterium]